MPYGSGEVTYRRDLDGTHADLVPMPPGAFRPEPTLIMSPPWATNTPAPGGGAAANPSAGTDVPNLSGI